MKKNIKWLFLVSLAIMASCNSDDNDTPAEVPVVPGTADFAKYIALGDSFAAGYSDNALFKKGQENSYPNILSQQFAAAGGGAFAQPLMNDNIGGLLLGGNVIAGTRLYFVGQTQTPTNVTGKPTTEVTAHLSGTFGNLGVPGAKSYHLLAANYGNVAGVATGAANPYYARFASTSSATVIGDAVAQNPTFFSLFIGGNDVLAYATSGGTGKDQTGNPNPATYGGSDITDPTVFASVYTNLITALTAKGAKGVVANLPYITALPHFTTVPYNPLTAKVIGKNNEAVGVATIKALNAQLYGPLKQALTAFNAGDRINLLSETGASPLLIKDETLTNLSAQLTAAFTPTLGAQNAAFYGAVFGQARQAKATDLVLLTTRADIGTAPTAANSGIGIAPPAPLNAFGISYPLQDKHVLIPTEIAEIKKATDAYNTTIQAVATEKGLAFVDTKATLTQLASGGIRFGNFTMSSSFATGGAFSLDGVHPSARGYGLIANIFIDAINAKYSSTLRHVDLGIYPIQYPETLP
ncbi:lysophospholipase L1-like esterase [Flavobacterium nitrogenifigens]|uniref:Lysophospholipase L1-like esterase n=2 Tax=Flavobacterium TaxID=237 RepID=A0A7W7IV75_9FLAO|nr:MULTISPECIES: G-D-S-L family lipolytic protein [Flavobacterium]MBB4801025.1 lysophospholipase L1-like esterase [Flavobacterium nitrogenifigens]MBB6385227.1 lysophospholipase L1-like esterase [Flavobacterium notoginsengisoli]